MIDVLIVLVGIAFWGFVIYGIVWSIRSEAEQPWQGPGPGQTDDYQVK